MEPWLKNKYKGSKASGIGGQPKAGREEVKGNVRNRGKTKLFPSGPYIKCILYYVSLYVEKWCLLDKHDNNIPVYSLNSL